MFFIPYSRGAKGRSKIRGEGQLGPKFTYSARKLDEKIEIMVTLMWNTCPIKLYCKTRLIYQNGTQLIFNTEDLDQKLKF